MHSQDVLLCNSCMYSSSAPVGGSAGSAIKTINPLRETDRDEEKMMIMRRENAIYNIICLISVKPLPRTSFVSIFKCYFS